MFDAYKVAVKLTLVNHVSTGLAAIASQLGHVNSRFGEAQAGAAALERKLLDIKRMGLIGGALAGAGYGGLSLFKGPLEEAKKFDQAVGKFKLFGMGDAVNAEAIKFAKGMDTIGTSYVDNMKLITEAQGVFRESGHSGLSALQGAKLAAPMLSKIHFATEALDEESKSKMRTSSLAMLRFVEMRGGLQSPEAFNKIANEGWKAVQSSGGNVNWEQMRQAMSKARTVLGNAPSRGLYGEDEPLIGELKGGAYGDGLMTAYNRLTGVVKLPNQVAHMLAKNGIWDASKIVWNAHGGIKEFKGNPFKDLDLLVKSRLEFYEKKILPMYQQMGLSENEIARDNALVFGRTGGKLFNLVHSQRKTMHESADAWDKARGVDASVDVAKGTLSGKEVDLHAKWRNSMQQLGETILPLAIKAVTGMTSALKGFTDFAKDHPTLIKTLSIAFVGLSGAMAFGGTVLLLKTGFKGLGVALELLGAPGGAIGAATKAVGLFGKALGVLGAVAAAWAAGQFAGSVINDHLSDQTKDTIGRTIAKTLAFFGNREAQEALDAERRSQTRSVVPPPSNHPVQVHTQVNMDGFRVANIVSKHQAKSMARPQVGPSGFDGSMNLRALGSGFAG